MALFNYTAKEITLKVVYYGPGFSGKTTNLQHLHSILPYDARGKLISLATEGDRTLFFDFLPVNVGKIKDFNIKFQLYTVPGQVKYNATRRLVLKGVDAVVFVADSQKAMKEQNIESFNNMIENLVVDGLNMDDIPVVLQYNKRDLGNIMDVEELNSDLNKRNSPFFEAIAVEGRGVHETFNEVTDVLLKYITEKHKIDIRPPEETVLSTPEMSIPGAFPSETETQRPVMIPSEPQPALLLSDLSKLIEAIGELKGIVSEINSILKEMQNKQTQIINELFELRQIFLKTDKKKGLRRFFQ
jgi:signal recognition particle receptor subunit beta